MSLTEVSEYSKGMPEEMLQARLHPQLPPEGKKAVCFYPMSKRREVGANWFTLPFDERKELMYGHGKSGREFAGEILQVITGSTGLDDWEWGVTLFADDPVDLKEFVYRCASTRPRPPTPSSAPSSPASSGSPKRSSTAWGCPRARTYRGSGRSMFQWRPV